MVLSWGWLMAADHRADQKRGTRGHIWPCGLFYLGNWDGDRPRVKCTGGCSIPELAESDPSERRGACRECAGTGWACQPPRCQHPLHVQCPWCHGSGKASTPQIITTLQDALVAIQDIALAAGHAGEASPASFLNIESIARYALRESAWEPTDGRCTNCGARNVAPDEPCMTGEAADGR